MKFISKFILFIFLLYLPDAFSRDVVLISFNSYGEKAKLVQKILEEKIHIPNNLIQKRKRDLPCENDHEADFHICIDESGEMIVLKRNENLLKTAFGIFQKGYEGDEEDENEQK